MPGRVAPRACTCTLKQAARPSPAHGNRQRDDAGLELFSAAPAQVAEHRVHGYGPDAPERDALAARRAAHATATSSAPTQAPAPADGAAPPSSRRPADLALKPARRSARGESVAWPTAAPGAAAGRRARDSPDQNPRRARIVSVLGALLLELVPGECPGTVLEGHALQNREISQCAPSARLCARLPAVPAALPALACPATRAPLSGCILQRPSPSALEPVPRRPCLRCCGGRQPAGCPAAREPDQRAAAARLLKYLGERGALELAVRVFDWLDARPAYPTRDAYHYVALMSAFSRRGAANDAARVRHNPIPASSGSRAGRPRCASPLVSPAVAGGGSGRRGAVRRGGARVRRCPACTV